VEFQPDSARICGNNRHLSVCISMRFISTNVYLVITIGVHHYKRDSQFCSVAHPLALADIFLTYV